MAEQSELPRHLTFPKLLLSGVFSRESGWYYVYINMDLLIMRYISHCIAVHHQQKRKAINNIILKKHFSFADYEVKWSSVCRCHSAHFLMRCLCYIALTIANRSNISHTAQDARPHPASATRRALSWNPINYKACVCSLENTECSELKVWHLQISMQC